MVPFPFLQGLLPLERSRIPAEMIAGLTLASLAIPEVMGYTKIAGTPVVTGLYTMLLPMALFALFGSSRHLVVGADSATAAILASSLAGMAVSGSAEYVALTGLLAIMAAVLLLLARLIRLGFLADFLSRTVLVGFLTGVGIQVACGAVPGLLGIENSGHGVIAKLTYTLGNLDQVSLPAILVSAAVLAVILVCGRVSPRIPGPLLAVLGAILASWLLNLGAHGVALLGPVPGGLPSLSLPEVDLSWQLIAQLLPTAGSIFVVILAQSAATARAYATRYNDRFDENLDLVGLGLANLGAGFTGSFVVNGSPTKTEMVDTAGGRSQLAHATTVVVVLLVLLFLTGPLAYLPSAVLSAVVFMIGLHLVDLAGMRKIHAEARSEFWVALATAVVVVAAGVETGIMLAMVLSLIDHTRKGYNPRNAVITKASRGGWRLLSVAEPEQFEPGLLVYRFTHSLYYANAQRFADEVAALVAGAKPPLRWFCIEAGAIDDVDFSGGQVLLTVCNSLREAGIRVVLVSVSPEVEAELRRYGLTALLGEEAFYPSSDALVAAYRQDRDPL